MNELKKKFILNLSVAVLLVAAFLYVGARYLVKDIETYSGKIVSDEQAVYRQSTRNAQLPELRKRYEAMKGEMEAAYASVIGEEETVNFIEEVEKAAIRNKVKLDIKDGGEGQSSSEQSQTKEKNLLATTRFTIRAGGTFDNVMHFLGEMENFKYCSKIENVSMTYENFDQYNKDVVVLDLTVKLYQATREE